MKLWEFHDSKLRKCNSLQ